MEKQNMIEEMNTLLKAVEPLKFSLEISNNEEEIEYLRNQIKAQYVEINALREKLDLVRGV